MMLLPIVLRLVARFEGKTTRSAVELSLMTRYFLFQVIVSGNMLVRAPGELMAIVALVLDRYTVFWYHRSAAATGGGYKLNPCVARE